MVAELTPLSNCFLANEDSDGELRRYFLEFAFRNSPSFSKAVSSF